MFDHPFSKVDKDGNVPLLSRPRTFHSLIMLGQYKLFTPEWQGCKEWNHEFRKKYLLKKGPICYRCECVTSMLSLRLVLFSVNNNESPIMIILDPPFKNVHYVYFNQVISVVGWHALYTLEYNM